MDDKDLKNWNRDPEDLATDARTLRILVILLVVAIPLAGILHHQRQGQRTAAMGAQLQAVQHHAPSRDDAFTDMPDAGSPWTSLPSKPEPWQKEPPCDPDSGEEPINGACYGAMKRRPPCGPKLTQHGDTCYRPVAKAIKPPVSDHP